MRKWQAFSAAAALLALSSTGMAAQISGEYLESRTCSVYTGPCFANAEMGLAGNFAGEHVADIEGISPFDVRVAHGCGQSIIG